MEDHEERTYPLCSTLSNSARHDLSQDSRFVKINRTLLQPGRGCFWGMRSPEFTDGGRNSLPPASPITSRPDVKHHKSTTRPRPLRPTSAAPPHPSPYFVTSPATSNSFPSYSATHNTSKSGHGQPITLTLPEPPHIRYQPYRRRSSANQGATPYDARWH